METINKREIIVLIGVGNIGSRWLEGILNMRKDWDIFCVENNPIRIESLKSEYGERINVLVDYNGLPKSIDLCAITTASSVRKEIFDNLINACNVKNIIFEKFLFQREIDYYDVLDKLEKKGIKAWVNCTRRVAKGYRRIKGLLNRSQYFSCQIGGAEWGLACNGIHFLDIIKYISGANSIHVDTRELRLPIVESKRKGYLEFFGSVKGFSGKCTSFSISCKHEDKPSEIQVMICSDIGVYVINETRKSICLCEKDNGWKWREEEFELPYTSQIMGKIIDGVLRDGKSDLPSYSESMQIHLQYLRGINMFLENNYDWREEICPIT